MKTQSISKLLLVFFLMAFQVITSQSFNYEEELKRIEKVPNTPEADAFAKYGNTQVNMYSGTPNISIPLYTIQGNELSLPISLSYDASGVRVSQLATGVGMNWNLNVGGRISRIANGLVDDYLWVSNNSYKSVQSSNSIYLQGEYENKTLKELIEDHLDPPQEFNSQEHVEDYFQFLKDIGDNKLDTQPDYFSFNALGISDHFVYDMDTSTYVALDNPRIKASVMINANPEYIVSWIITNDDGTKFYFDLAEKTKSIGLDIGGSSTIIQDYYSSWVLTKIVSPSSTDVYEFEYEDFEGVLMANQPLITTASITNELNYPNDPDSPGARNISSRITEYKISQLALVRVKHNTKIVIDISLKIRNDFDAASAIDKIDIKNYNNTGIIKSYKLNHSYFGTVSSNNFSQRLKLDSIQINSANNTLSSYQFDYFSPTGVPSRGSLERDFLGYYNGKTINTTLNVLYPAVTVSGFDFEGADRFPDFSKAIYGTLQKITYPTGGYTEFLYEPNKTTFTTQDINSSVDDVTHGSLTVTANSSVNYSNSSCGACCQDQYGGVNNIPNINGTIFTISDPGEYDITFINDAGSFGEAYLFKRSEGIKPNAPVMPYDDVINQSGLCDINILDDLVWSNFIGNNGSSVYLGVGTYQITLAKGKPQSGSNVISLRVHRDEITNNTTINTGEVIRAGFRVKSIKDYSASGVLSTEKEYIYKTEINGSDSSGKIMFNPTFYTVHSYTMFAAAADQITGTTAGINNRTQLRRSSSWSGGDRPHVGYSTVYERQKAAGLENGFIKHTFNTGIYAGVYSTGVSPNASLYRRDFSVGKETSSTVFKDIANSTNTEEINKELTGFFDDVYFGNTTLYIDNNPTRNYQFVRIYPGSTDYGYDFVDATISGFTGQYGPGSLITATQPPSCDPPNKCLTLEYSTFETKLTYAQGRVGGVSSKSNYQYFPGDTIRTFQRSIYDSGIDHLLRELKSVTSHQDSISTKYYYPKDFAGTTVYDDMINKNMLNTVIKTESFQETSKLFTQENTYKKWSTNVIKPEFIKTAKGTATLEERIHVYSYDFEGNAKEVSQTDGSHIVYIWGYNKEYLVAKVVNATYAQVEALSYFGSSFTITNGLSTNQENSLLGNLPNSMVTIYKYTDPRIGVSSIIDPNGYTTSYEYDEFNRLKRVKDSDGKILSENTYQYKN